MKHLTKIFVILLLAFSLTSCDWIKKLVEPEEKTEPNVIKGDTNIPINEVGNKFSTTVKIGTQVYPLNEEIKIIKNDAGVITVGIKADPGTSTKVQDFLKKLPINVTDVSGKINTEIKLKSSTEGIQNFTLDGKLHTIAKYDAKLGDTYTQTTSDGKTLTRKVVQRSSVDDFPYGNMNIKVVTVEQNSTISGIRKYIYKANHKFGLVHIEIILEDGTSISSYIFSQNN